MVSYVDSKLMAHTWHRNYEPIATLLYPYRVTGVPSASSKARFGP